MTVTVEARVSEIGSDLGWAPAPADIASATEDIPAPSQPESVLWSGTISFATEPRPGEFRVVVREFEVTGDRPGHRFSQPPGLRRHLALRLLGEHRSYDMSTQPEDPAPEPQPPYPPNPPYPPPPPRAARIPRIRRIPRTAVSAVPAGGGPGSAPPLPPYPPNPPYPPPAGPGPGQPCPPPPCTPTPPPTTPPPTTQTPPPTDADTAAPDHPDPAADPGRTPPPTTQTPPPTSGRTPPPTSGHTPPPTSGHTPPPTSGHTPRRPQPHPAADLRPHPAADLPHATADDPHTTAHHADSQPGAPRGATLDVAVVRAAPTDPLMNPGWPADGSFFVSIAAYRDPDLLPTIADCLAKARHPDRLRFGICWQYGPELAGLRAADRPAVRACTTSTRG